MTALLADPAALNALNGTSRAGPTGPTPGMTRAEAEQAARDFESFFVARTIDSLMAGVETSAPFGGGPGEGAWRSFLSDAYAAEVSKQGGFGIADQLMAELINVQAGANAPTTEEAQ